MSINIPNSFNAYGSVSSTGATVSGAGFTASKAATGSYVLTLDEEVDAAECAILTTPRGTTPLVIAVSHTSDSQKQVSVYTTAGAAADGAFDFCVLRTPST